MGQAEDGLGVDPSRAAVAAIVEHVVHPAVEVDLLGVFGPNNLPRIAEDHPIVRMLDLMAADELLLEKAELVVDPIPDRGIVEGRERIEKARGEAAQAAVAEAHVGLGLADGDEVLPEGGERRLRRLQQAGGQQVGFKQPPHVIFEREIVDAADVVGVVHRLGGDHPPMEHVAHGERGRHPPVARRGRTGMARERRDEVALDQGAHHFDRAARGGVRGENGADHLHRFERRRACREGGRGSGDGFWGRRGAHGVSRRPGPRYHYG